MTVQRIHRCFRLHRYSTANAGGGVSDVTKLVYWTAFTVGGTAHND